MIGSFVLYNRNVGGSCCLLSEIQSKCHQQKAHHAEGPPLGRPQPVPEKRQWVGDVGVSGPTSGPKSGKLDWNRDRRPFAAPAGHKRQICIWRLIWRAASSAVRTPSAVG